MSLVSFVGIYLPKLRRICKTFAVVFRIRPVTHTQTDFPGVAMYESATREYVYCEKSITYDTPSCDLFSRFQIQGGGIQFPSLE